MQVGNLRYVSSRKNRVRIPFTVRINSQATRDRPPNNKNYEKMGLDNSGTVWTDLDGADGASYSGGVLFNEAGRHETARNRTALSNVAVLGLDRFNDFGTGGVIESAGGCGKPPPDGATVTLADRWCGGFYDGKPAPGRGLLNFRIYFP